MACCDTVYKIIGVIFLIFLVKKVQSDAQWCQNVITLCYGQTSCQDCIRAHPCCNWCYQKDYPGPPCDLKERMTECRPDFIMENRHPNYTFVQNNDFTNVENADVSNVIQFQPQEINIALRTGQPINITVRYQPAKNYPLDLYYLMDLTLSMKPDLDTLRNLGIRLTQTLSDLTTFYRIAFGSYVDKTEMPFYLTDPVNYENPCNLVGTGERCDKGYLFKHRLNFTDNVDTFFDKIKSSSVSANVDNLEGGLDALMQILICDSRLGWSKYSRKIVVLATESQMHLAGDGLLSGSVIKNPHKCLIDKDGTYTEPLLYDYPSLEELHREMTRAKINIIVAAKNNSYFYYNLLGELIPEHTFVGVLEENSVNILELVKDGFYDFIRQTKLSINTTGIDGLNVEFFADCHGNGVWNKTDSCYSVEEGKPVDFMVQLDLEKYQDKKYDTLFIEERNVQERIRLNLEYIDAQCDCPSLNNQNQNCGHGIADCGKCRCTEGWTGDQCDEPCDTNILSCRYSEGGMVSKTCFGNGDCICGTCQCYFPLTGTYCNYTCPFDSKTKIICGGPNKGSCLDGKCICQPMFTGEDCTCSLSQLNCKIPGGQLCNGHGTCQCDTCKCDSGYGGKYCETCDQCEGLCNLYMPCVVANVHNESDTCAVQNAVVHSERVAQLKTEEEGGLEHVCYYRYKKDGEDCEAEYTYAIKKENFVNVAIKGPSCSSPTQAIALGGYVLAAILGLGILGLAIWKIVVSRTDKIEYERFIKEQKQFSQREENPIYRSPIVRYENPMEMGAIKRRSHN